MALLMMLPFALSGWAYTTDQLNALSQQWDSASGESFTDFCRRTSPIYSNQQDISQMASSIVRSQQRAVERLQPQRARAQQHIQQVTQPTSITVSGDLAQRIANYQNSVQVRNMVASTSRMKRSTSGRACVRGVKSYLGQSGVSRDFAGDGTIRSWDLERSLQRQNFENLINARNAQGQRLFQSPADAPVGSILIYYDRSRPLNGRSQGGHAEIRVPGGAVSDFRRSFGSGNGQLGAPKWELVGIYIRDFGSSPQTQLAANH